jgi:peptidoglycan hydrolase-like protein with peptidoglycan-binding domain
MSDLQTFDPANSTLTQREAAQTQLGVKPDGYFGPISKHALAVWRRANPPSPVLTLVEALAPFRGQFSDAFLTAMAFTLDQECEFESGHYDDYNFVRTENVPGDGGGLTKYGIDARSHEGVDIAGLDMAGALAVYHGGEWEYIKGDSLPESIALAVEDAAVNVGEVTAAKWLQRAVGVTQDGLIGEATLSAVAQQQVGLVDSLIDGYRNHYYEVVAANHPSDEKFENGWLTRVSDLEKVLAA